MMAEARLVALLRNFKVFGRDDPWVTTKEESWDTVCLYARFRGVA